MNTVYALVVQYKNATFPRRDGSEILTLAHHFLCKKERRAKMSEQRTYEIEATEGIDYLVLDNGEDIQEIFERYKNDEAGEYLKKADAKLISWEVVN